LVTFASGLADLFVWDTSPVDQTPGIPAEGAAIGYVTVTAPKGSVEFRRWSDVSARKGAQPGNDTTIAGCADVTVTFRYEDKEAAAAEAMTATNLLQVLNGGDCETISATSTTRSRPDVSTPDRQPPFDLAMDSCSTDRFGFVTATGTVRNNSDGQQSYYVEVKIVSSDEVRIGYGNGFAWSVDPGQTATWSVIGTADATGAVTCKYSADELG